MTDSGCGSMTGAVQSKLSEPKVLAPGLYLVGTPIGNLEDITLRALRVLSSVSAILAEDTRTSRKLMDHFCIRTPLVSYHTHNERSREADVLARLRRGEALAIISDAGMPVRPREPAPACAGTDPSMINSVISITSSFSHESASSEHLRGEGFARGISMEGTLAPPL